MPRVTVFHPPHDDECDLCGETSPIVIIRKVGDVRDKHKLCGKCLALALQDITKQNWLSQYVLWQANSALGKEIQESKRVAKEIKRISRDYRE